MKNIRNLLLLLCLSTSACGFAYPELPFLTFSDAFLSVKNQKVFGNFEYGDYCSFPILSYQPPKVVKKKEFSYLKKHSHGVDGDILLIVDVNFEPVAHYFHFMEHLIGIWNFFTYQNPDNIKLILLAFETSTPEDNQWVGANQASQTLLKALFPNANIQLLKNMAANLTFKTNRIFVSSRLRSHGIPESGYHNMNGSSRFYYNHERLEQMRDRLFTNMNINMEPRSDTLRVTYCKRSTGRILDPALEHLLLDNLSRECNCCVKVVDFATISFHEQLRIIANTDLLIGIHGNGLTHLLLLPNKSTVLEYYQGGESAFFRLFAQLRGLRYYGNSQNRWVTESYNSLENKAPFQDRVTNFDLKTTMHLIRKLSNQNLH